MGLTTGLYQEPRSYDAAKIDRPKIATSAAYMWKFIEFLKMAAYWVLHSSVKRSGMARDHTALRVILTASTNNLVE